MHRLETSIRLERLLLGGRLIKQLQEREIPSLRRLMMCVCVVIVRGWKSRGSDVFKSLSIFLIPSGLIYDGRHLIPRTWVCSHLSILLYAS